MSKQVGLWIDHREALIVRINDGEEEIKHIPFNIEKHSPGTYHSRTSEARKEFASEDEADKKTMNQYNKYYGEVIAAIHDAEYLQIFGPGEAKVEFKKRLEAEGLKDRIVCVETLDKLTDHQFASIVRERFQA